MHSCQFFVLHKLTKINWAYASWPQTFAAMNAMCRCIRTCVRTLSIMPLQFTTRHGGIPENRHVGLPCDHDRYFLWINLYCIRGLLDVHKHRHISSDKLSRILVGRTHRSNDETWINQHYSAYNVVLLSLTNSFLFL